VILPNFIGIGAPKAGTTWLANCLGEHPEIFMAAVKEIEFWKLSDAEHRLEEYAAHFRGANNAKAVGEFSVRYLSFPGVPERLKRVLPEVKLLVSLRNPVDQVYSNYWHLQRQNFNLHDPTQAPCSLEEALAKQRDFLLAPARYALHLQRWLAQFAREQLLIVLFDDIESKPAEVLGRVFAFLDVDPNFVPPSLREKGSAVRAGASPKSEKAARWHAKIYDRLVGSIYSPMKKWMGTHRAARIKDALRIRPLMERVFMRSGYPPMDQATRTLLAKEFAPEIGRLEQMTGLNLSSWMNETSTPSRRRLAILATHPIQYFAPWFRHLATIFDLEVLYAHRQDVRGQSAAGFGVDFEWDVPLLEGYPYRFLKNVSSSPGLQSFGGCDTPELYDLIRPENYDALLVLGWARKSFIQGILAARRNHVPVLLRGDSQLGTMRSYFKRAVKYVPYRLLLPRINAHLYVGKRNREYLRHYGVREERLFFSPHFIDNDFFATRAAKIRDQRAEIRRQWEIPDDAFCILFVGKFIPKKRPLDLVKAAQLLTTDNRLTNIHLLFVGSGELGDQLRAHCHVVFDAEKSSPTFDLRSPTSGTKPRASFAGFRNQSELPALYVAADVLVLPSDADETWGLVVNEAMACGVPAIVSDAVGCARDLIDEDSIGRTFPCGDVDSLAQQLINFRVVDRDALQQKCEAYSIERATEGLQKAVEAITARKR
jgi:glycosyltransferase involved in cell wall biosynthesis